MSAKKSPAAGYSEASNEHQVAGNHVDDSTSPGLSETALRKQGLRMYLEGQDRTALRKLAQQDPDRVAAGVLAMQNAVIVEQNARLHAGERGSVHPKIGLRSDLGVYEVVMLLVTLHYGCLLTAEGKGKPLPAIYDDNENSRTYGTYRVAPDELMSLATRYGQGMDTRALREVVSSLGRLAPRRNALTAPNLVAVNNGVFDFDTKVLHPLGPEHVFTSKIGVDYVAGATNPLIAEADGSTWDVASWMDGLSDDPEVVDLLWKAIGALCRPYVKWNKVVCFYSTRGNNGKGTLLALMRTLVGPGNWINLPLVSFGAQFGLAELLDAGLPQAVLTDENPVGVYIERADNLKAAITHDALSIERKGVDRLSVVWNGVMVQCVNDLPKFRDRTESLVRRMLMVPFDKWFGDLENKRIRNDYLERPEVLQYVLHRVLNMEPYDSLPEPAACVRLRVEFSEKNNPVLDFWTEHLYQFTWDLLPFTFLYEMYKAWSKRTNPSGKVLSARQFKDDLLSAITSEGLDEVFACHSDPRQKYRTDGRISCWAEPLLGAYRLDAWIDGWSGDRVRLDKVKPTERGLLRRPGAYIPRRTFIGPQHSQPGSGAGSTPGSGPTSPDDFRGVK